MIWPITFGDHEQLVLVRLDNLERPLIWREVIWRLATDADLVVRQQRHDCRQIRCGGATDDNIAMIIHRYPFEA
jgi:hypothetical protein